MNNEPDSTFDDDEIVALVKRLARPLPSGGQVIERAAILAAGGPDFGKVIDWLIAHDGKPEAVAAAAPSGGLHGGRLQSAPASTPPSRFVLPPGALE